MSRKHKGLGRGLDALIPKRMEIEKEFSEAAGARTEVFFSDDEPEEQPVFINPEPVRPKSEPEEPKKAEVPGEIAPEVPVLQEEVKPTEVQAEVQKIAEI